MQESFYNFKFSRCKHVYYKKETSSGETFRLANVYHVSIPKIDVEITIDMDNERCMINSKPTDLENLNEMIAKNHGKNRRPCTCRDPELKAIFSCLRKKKENLTEFLKNFSEKLDKIHDDERKCMKIEIDESLYLSVSNIKKMYFDIPIQLYVENAVNLQITGEENNLSIFYNKLETFKSKKDIIQIDYIMQVRNRYYLEIKLGYEENDEVKFFYVYRTYLAIKHVLYPGRLDVENV